MENEILENDLLLTRKPRVHPFELFLKIAVWAASVITISALLFIIVFILAKGIMHLSPSLFALKYTSDNVSLLPALISTAIITFFSLLIAAPLGIAAAIWLVEYASKNNKTVPVIRLMTETLSGIPSIVFGLFGMLFFVTFLGFKFSIISGSLTLAIMILPLMIRSTEEALRSVPSMYREGSFGLGAGKLRTIFKVVLPAAAPGITAGIILGAGRVVGETAALIFTAGTASGMPTSLTSSARTLSTHMYVLFCEGHNMDKGYATAVILLVLVMVINFISTYISKKLGVKK